MLTKIKSRIKTGVNFFSVLGAARELFENPEFEPSSKQEIAEKILEKIINKKLPKARKSDPQIDWDSLLEFIEKILPIILSILSIFI